jgi:hypothetical protein
LPPLVAAKLALYEAMRAQRMTRTELARRLGRQENAVRRLLDLDHRSHIDQIDRALAALGVALSDGPTFHAIEPTHLPKASADRLPRLGTLPPGMSSAKELR